MIYWNLELVLFTQQFQKERWECKIYPYQSYKSKVYFTHHINGGGDNMYTADNICKMIEFLIDNILCGLEGVFSVR